MKNIRSCIFETNSSSSHSISISKKCKTYDTIVPDENGVIPLTGGEFGWGIKSYNDALTKANYCAVDIVYAIENNRRDKKSIFFSRELCLKKKMLVKVIKEHTGAKKVVFDFSVYLCGGKKFSYIDHQSIGRSDEAFRSKKSLKDFIFNPRSILLIDHDNH